MSEKLSARAWNLITLSCWPSSNSRPQSLHFSHIFWPGSGFLKHLRLGLGLFKEPLLGSILEAILKWCLQYFRDFTPPCLHLSGFLEPPSLADVIFGLTPPQVVPALLLGKEGKPGYNELTKKSVVRNQYILKPFLTGNSRQESRSSRAWNCNADECSKYDVYNGSTPPPPLICIHLHFENPLPPLCVDII